MHVKISSAKSLMSKVVKECPADPIEFLIGKLQAIQRQRRKVYPIYDYMQSFGEGSRLGINTPLCVICMYAPEHILCFFFQSASPAHTTSSTIGLRSKMQITGKSVTPKSTATTKGVIAIYFSLDMYT